MPVWEFDGYGRDSGRKRHRSYCGRTMDEAIAQAAADGTIVDPASAVRVGEDPPPAPVGEQSLSHFYSKVAGISHYQDIARRCYEGQMLPLMRDLDNPYSDHAIGVYFGIGPLLGYLPDHTAMNVCRDMDRGDAYFCWVAECTGGSFHKPNYGVNLLVVRCADLNLDDSILFDYVVKLIPRAEKRPVKHTEYLPDSPAARAGKPLPKSDEASGCMVVIVLIVIVLMILWCSGVCGGVGS